MSLVLFGRLCLLACFICTAIFLYLCAHAPLIETDDYE